MLDLVKKGRLERPFFVPDVEEVQAIGSDKMTSLPFRTAV